jgi:murein DD-endopeptidase MepM/ murein hydrolase activator NlpD
MHRELDCDVIREIRLKSHFQVILIVIFILLAGMLACSRGDSQITRIESQLQRSTLVATATLIPTSTPTTAPTEVPPMPTLEQDPVRPSPTPDAVRPSPEFRTSTETHVVRYGDTLNYLANRYGVASSLIQVANGLNNPNLLAIGQILTIPPPTPEAPGPSFKILPDSELVYGPSVLDIESILKVISPESSLATYFEEVDDVMMTGPEIIQMTAENYSVNPRLLLAVLEFQSRWVRGDREDIGFDMFPIGWYDEDRKGLASQIYWAADQLNAGFYRWRAGWLGPYVFPDGRVVPPGPGVNAATVAVQYLFSQLYSVEEWRQIVTENGFSLTYESLFGDPLVDPIEPLIPPDLAQPTLALPFEQNVQWSFTGGPHSAFGNRGPWAALDFAPSSNTPGCYASIEWVTAVAEGVVVRSERGQIIQDLGADGLEQTGWVIFYLHIDTYERVPEGTYLQVGDRIGHPSCEGGISTGSHLHIARKYNGVWIETEGAVPFVLGGWASKTAGYAYEGSLIKGDEELKACACRASYNQISH